MTDQNTPPAPVAPVVAQPATPPAAPPEPAADGGGLSLDGLTDAQVDAIQQRIEERRANRPPSLAEQLDALTKQIAGTADRQGQAAQTRKDAREEADELGQTLSELKATMRRMELKEAAQAAKFKHPDKVVDFIAPHLTDGANLTELVSQAAASGVFVMDTPAPSAPIGGPNSQQTPGKDPGRAALEQEIRQAQGR